MNRYRATFVFSYDFETEEDYEQALRRAEDDLNKVTDNLLVSRKHVRIEKLKNKKHKIKLGEFKPEEVLLFLDNERKEYVVGDKKYYVRMNSPRYYVFRNSLNCVACGLVGTKMILEQNPRDKSPHFNLYAIENGKLILMTKDHIVARAYGGSDSFYNYNTMCSVCNNIKGPHNLNPYQVKILRDIYSANEYLPRKKQRKLVEDALNGMIK